MAQVGEFAGDEILQASRSSDYKFAAGAKTVDLRLFRYAADNQRRLRHVLIAQLFVLLVNLHGEFARGQQDQGADILGCSILRRFSAQHLDDRNQERESLAGAGLGGADYVLAFKGRSNGARLDGCEGNELSCRQLLLQGSRKGSSVNVVIRLFSFWRGLVDSQTHCREFACRSH